MRPAPIRRRLGAAGLLVVLVTALAPMTVAAGEEDTFDPSAPSSSAFEVTAAAEGFRFGVRAPGAFIVEQFVDAGAPVSQALVDSIGNARAFAANPYPGDLIVTGPGTFSALTGAPKLGDYPFYAASSFPAVPEAKLSQPGYELSARSTETSASSFARSGGSSGDSALLHAVVQSTATHDPDSGGLEAAAASTVTGLSVGGVLRVGRATATAKVSRPKGGDLKRTSSFTVDVVSIGGQAVVLSEKGISLPGGKVPLPDSSPLLGALEQAKITVNYLSALEDPEGVVSPGLLITHTMAFPGGPNIIVSIVLGRATAHAGAQVVASAPPAGGGEVPAGVDPAIDGFVPATPPVPPAPTPTVFTTVPDAAALGSLPPGVGAYIPAGADFTGAVPDAAFDSSAGAPQAPAVAALASPAAVSRRTGSTFSLYVVVALGALLAALGSQLVRTRAVRSPWSS
ncbi:MAG: hypothetical protein ACRD0O_08225 [Acidimicrobiia bacterium]